MPASEFSDVFVSYRRLDVEFVKRLVEDLQKDDKEVWVDWEDIPPGIEGFADEIKRGLEGADTFIAVLSPDYLDSTYCVDMELAYAAKLKKKIIPIVLKKFDDHKIPESIGHINWIYFTPHAGQDNTYEESFPKILDVMHTDLDHVRLHKRFLLRAIEWDEGKNERSFLLNGEEIENAQTWLANAAGKEPIPTDLHRSYITESIKLRKRQQQLLLSGITVALVISIVLAILSLIGFNDANIAQATALANLDLASTAQAEAEANESIAATAQAEAEDSAELAKAAQAEAEANEALAETAREESERNLRDARQSQALFHGDLAQQQSNRGLHQRALLLGLQALKFNVDGITSDSAYMAVHKALHQSIHRTLHLDFPNGITEVIWGDDNQQVLITTEINEFITCPEVLDCTPRVEIWDTASKERIAYLVYEHPYLQTVLWNQSDNQVLTLSRDYDTNQSQIGLWDIATETLIYQVNHDYDVDWLEWDAGGEYFVASEYRCDANDTTNCTQSAVVYEYATGDEFKAFAHGQIPLYYAHISSDNQFLEVSEGYGRRNTPTIYNLATGETINTYDEILRRGVFWQDNDTRIITTKDSKIISQDLATGDILYSISSTSNYDVMGNVVILSPRINCEDACGELQIYDATTGEYRFTTSHPETDIVLPYHVIQDSKYLLTITDEFSLDCVVCETAIYLWSLDTGELLHTFDYDGWIEYGDFEDVINPDETLLLTHSINDVEHHIVTLWDIETGEIVDTIDIERGVVASVHFDDSGQHFIAHRVDIVEIYNVATTHLQHTLAHPTTLIDSMILHDGNTITTYSETDVTFWEVVDWQATLRNPMDIIFDSEEYSPDQSQLVTWKLFNGLSETVEPNAYVWDVETGKLLFTLETDSPIHHAMWSPDRKSIVISQETCDGDCIVSLLVFDARAGKLRNQYDGISANGGWYSDTNQIISRQSDVITILDIDTGETVYSSDMFVLGENQYQWNSDYTEFAIPTDEDTSLSIVRYPSNDIIQSISLDDIFFDIQWANLDQIIVLLLATETSTDLVGFDVATGEEVYRVTDAGIYEVSYDTTQIVLVTANNELQGVDASTGDIMWTSPTLNEQWTDIQWSPDNSKIILSGFFASQAEMFDAESGNVLKVFPYSQLEWSPDSRYILVFDDNTDTVVWRVFDIGGDRMLFSFQPSSTPMWKHDSRGLVSYDGLWSLHFGDLIRRGEIHRVRELSEQELLEFFIKPPPDIEVPDHVEEEDDDD